MDRIQAQFTKLMQLLFAAQTAEVYQKALTLTGQILVETAQLLWLVLCSGFVLAAWLGDYATRSGKSFKIWLNTPSQGEGDSTEKLAATGQAFLTWSQQSVHFLLDKAHDQLGLEKPVRPVEVSPPVGSTEAGPPMTINTPLATAVAEQTTIEAEK